MLFHRAITLVAVVALLGNVSHANGGYIELVSQFSGLDDTHTPDVFLFHDPDSIEGYDSSLDAIYNASGSPRIDFFSMIPGYSLSMDSRDILSTSTYHTWMQGNGLTYPAEGTLNFIVAENDGYNLPENIWANIYVSQDGGAHFDVALADIAVRDYASSSEIVDLELLSANTVYKIDVGFVPEPSSLTLLGIAAGLMVLGWWRRRQLG